MVIKTGVLESLNSVEMKAVGLSCRRRVGQGQQIGYCLGVPPCLKLNTTLILTFSPEGQDGHPDVVYNSLPVGA